MAYTVSRNDASVSLDTFKIVRGPNKGKEYFAPTVTAENLDVVLKWTGKDHVVNFLQTILKRTGLNLLLDNIDEKTGVFNEAQYLIDWADFTSTGLSKGEMEEQFEDLVVEQQQFIESADLSNPADLAKLQEQKTRILGLKAMIDKKSRNKKAKEETAAPAEAAAPAAQ